MITSPDIAAELAAFDFSGDLESILAGLDLLLRGLEDILDGEVLGVPLPLVGDKLQGVGNVIRSFRTGLLDEIRTLPGKTPDLIEQAIVDALGPSGLYLLAGNVVQDSGPDHVQFNIPLQQTLQIGVLDPLALDFDIGLPGLGLEVDGQVDITLIWSLDLRVGASRDEGFYIDTSVPNEFSLTLDVTVSTLDATGSLGFLSLNVQDDAATPSRLSGDLMIDLVDPAGALPRLTATELATSSPSDVVVISPVNLVADLNLGASVQFPGGFAAAFPSLLFDFHLGWVFDDFPTSTAPPTIDFNNIRLDLGKFFSDFIGPTLGTVQDVLDPIMPILRILNTKVPVLSDFGALRSAFDRNSDGDVTILEVFLATAPLDPKTEAFIEMANELVNIISTLPASGGNLIVNVGSFHLNGFDPRDAEFQLNAIDLPATNETSAPDILTQLQSMNRPAEIDFLTSLDFAGLAGAVSGPGGNTLRFPLIDKPSLAFGLILGRPVDLFTYHMPALRLAAPTLNETFPILGPIVGQLVGTLALQADLLFGYDTFGADRYRKGPDGAAGTADDFSEPEALAEGFFVSDNVDNNFDPDEIVLSASLEVGGGVGIPGASATITGGIFADVGLNLNDIGGSSDGDGKVRADEIVANFPVCIFNVHGQLTAGLTARASVGVSFAKISWKKKIAEKVLLDFTFGCGPPQPPVLAAGGSGIVDGAGNALAADATDTWVRALTAQVVARHIFYNNSGFDGNDPAANANDDSAIATDKSVLFSGETATFANFTGGPAGITGIMIDVTDLLKAAGISASDFEFRMGNDDNPSSWSLAPAPSVVTARTGAGLNGSDRITIIWPDTTITNTWLEVFLKATPNTGPGVDDRFYIGNAAGDTGDGVLDAADEQAARANARGILNLAPIDDPFDFNRDGRVNTTDEIIARNNAGFVLNLITPAAPAAPSRSAPIVSVDNSELHSTGTTSTTAEGEDGSFPERDVQPARRRAAGRLGERFRVPVTDPALMTTNPQSREVPSARVNLEPSNEEDSPRQPLPSETHSQQTASPIDAEFDAVVLDRRERRLRDSDQLRHLVLTQPLELPHDSHGFANRDVNVSPGSLVSFLGHISFPPVVVRRDVYHLDQHFLGHHPVDHTVLKSKPRRSVSSPFTTQRLVVILGRWNRDRQATCDPHRAGTGFNAVVGLAHGGGSNGGAYGLSRPRIGMIPPPDW